MQITALFEPPAAKTKKIIDTRQHIFYFTQVGEKNMWSKYEKQFEVHVTVHREISL
jgi:hypothetical protein